MDINTGSFLADFVDKILQINQSETEIINGRHYSTKPLVYIPDKVDAPEELLVNSLDGVVKIIKQDHDWLPSPIFVRIDGADRVDVFTDFAGERHSIVPFRRFKVCRADFADSSIKNDMSMDYETAMIVLRSRFIQTAGTEYLLNLLSSITTENSAKSEDNGLTQTVTVKQGIAMKERVEVRPRVALRPFRTFFEVEQPESEFLVRIMPESQIRILEADGGIWKMKAKENIKNYFEEKLAEEIADGEVIVMM